MQTKEIISTIFVHGAQDSSSFILLHEHSAVFNIRLFIQIVLETSVRESDCLGNVLYAK